MQETKVIVPQMASLTIQQMQLQGQEFQSSMVESKNEPVSEEEAAPEKQTDGAGHQALKWTGRARPTETKR